VQGAGGTDGGVGQFFLGLVMMVAGGYLFFNAIHITNHFGLGYGLFRVGGVSITSGLVLIPFIFGVGMIFYNAKNIIGWLLAAASLIMLGFGVIAATEFRFQRMTAAQLIIILVLFVGGIGLFLNSLRRLNSKF